MVVRRILTHAGVMVDDWDSEEKEDENNCGKRTEDI